MTALLGGSAFASPMPTSPDWRLAACESACQWLRRSLGRERCRCAQRRGERNGDNFKRPTRLPSQHALETVLLPPDQQLSRSTMLSSCRFLHGASGSVSTIWSASVSSLRLSCNSCSTE